MQTQENVCRFRSGTGTNQMNSLPNEARSLSPITPIIFKKNGSIPYDTCLSSYLFNSVLTCLSSYLFNSVLT